MKTLTYTGPHLGVDVPLPNGGLVNVQHGQSASFTDELADALLEQEGQWSEPEPAAKKTARKGVTK